MLREDTYAGIEDLDRDNLRDVRRAFALLADAHRNWARANFPAGRQAELIVDKFDDPRRAAVALARVALLVTVEARPSLQELYDAASAGLLELIEEAEEADGQ